jgi:hypothetical protein
MGNPLFYDTDTEAAVNGAGALLNGGTLQIYSGGQPALNGSLTGTLLASLDLDATAFADATSSDGTTTAAANTVTSEDAAATGTAGYFALVDSDTNTQITGTVGVADSGADLILSSLSIVEGVSVGVTAGSLTLPQSGG